jgi:hypothetical protein
MREGPRIASSQEVFTASGRVRTCATESGKLPLAFWHELMSGFVSSHGPGCSSINTIIRLYILKRLGKCLLPALEKDATANVACRILYSARVRSNDTDGSYRWAKRQHISRITYIRGDASTRTCIVTVISARKTLYSGRLVGLFQARCCAVRE